VERFAFYRAAIRRLCARLTRRRPGLEWKRGVAARIESRLIRTVAHLLAGYGQTFLDTVGLGGDSRGGKQSAGGGKSAGKRSAQASWTS
jgi:hypothetical protein